VASRPETLPRIFGHWRLLHVLDQTRRSLAAARTEIAIAKAQTSTLSERLNEREEFAHAILDGIDVGVVTADPSGIVTFINRTAKNLLNVTYDKGGCVSDLLDLDRNPHEVLGDESNLMVAHPLSTHDGEELDLELSISRASTPSVGLPATSLAAHDQIGFFFIFRDLREEKLRRSERERLERLAAMGTMVAGFAHEVRNPVAALRSLAESLMEELADARITMPHVARMLEVLERVERLVRTSLQFGRPAAPQRVHCPPITVLNAALGELAPRTRAHDEYIRVGVEPDLPDIYVDDTQLVQVLVILINNALDSVGSPRRVFVQVARGRTPTPEIGERPRRSDSQPPGNRAFVRFEVTDDGPGIAPSMIGRIFDPFFTTKAAGTGLGLSIAQQLVNENGGTIEIASQRGTTTFTVAVPARDT
jgi:two-component system, NtrC family, sensor histidine kinase HydH